MRVFFYSALTLLVVLLGGSQPRIPKITIKEPGRARTVIRVCWPGRDPNVFAMTDQDFMCHTYDWYGLRRLRTCYSGLRQSRAAQSRSRQRKRMVPGGPSANDSWRARPGGAGPRSLASRVSERASPTPSGKQICLHCRAQCSFAGSGRQGVRAVLITVLPNEVPQPAGPPFSNLAIQPFITAAPFNSLISSLTILSMASMTRCDLAASLLPSNSPNTVGTICHDRPYLSLSQPHCTSFPPAESVFQNRSTSACVLQLTTNEMASVNLKCGPPLSARKSCPSSWNSTVITEPARRPETFSPAWS